MRAFCLFLVALGGLLAYSSTLSGHGSPPPPPSQPPQHPPWAFPDNPNGPSTGARPLPRRSGGAGPGSAPAGLPAGTPTSPGGNRGIPLPAGSRSPGSGGTLGLDLSSWYYWWGFNMESFLELRSRLEGDAAFSGSDGFFLGHGRRPGPASFGSRPDEQQVTQQIVPALKRALHPRPSNDTLEAIVIALARIGNDRPVRERMEIESLIRPFLREKNGKTSRTAVAALGILGHDPSAILLGEILLDQDEGRRALDESRVPTATRAFAAYALGLLANRSENEDVRRYVVHRLERALVTDETASADLAVASLIAFGRVPLAWSGRVPDRKRGQVVGMLHAAASREEQLLFLLDIVREKKTDRLVRAHAISALGLLTRGGEALHRELIAEVIDELAGRLEEERKVENEVLQSCAMALGLVADAEDPELAARVHAALLTSIRSSRDASTARFAMIALAQVFSREGGAASDAVKAGREELLRQLATQGGEDSSWAGLALAILERPPGESSARVSDPDVVVALHTCLREARSPGYIGCFSIAVGILGDAEAGDELQAHLEKSRDDFAQGLVAVGLGMLDVREASDAIQKLVEDSTYRPRLLREASIALGLLGDRDRTGILLSKLRETKSLSARSAIVHALARIGDVQAVDPLLEMLIDPEVSDGARTFVALALGLVADQDTLPWNSVFAANTNYLAAPPTYYSAESTGILNML